MEKAKLFSMKSLLGYDPIGNSKKIESVFGISFYSDRKLLQLMIGLIYGENFSVSLLKIFGKNTEKLETKFQKFRA